MKPNKNIKSKYAVISSEDVTTSDDIIIFIANTDMSDLYLSDVSGVWINGYTSDVTVSIIKKIRSNKYTWNLPIFVGGCVYIDINICDGVCDTIDEYITKCSELTIESNIIMDSVDKDMRPLLYACSRGVDIIKYESAEHAHTVIYPLLDIFSIYNAYSWLLKYSNSGLIHKSPKVLDNCRLCPSCFGSRFNFNEHCVSCNSKSITEIDLIHCFICNYVAPDSEMGHADEIHCPACKGKLVHRGVDYQHILNTYDCYECNNKSQDTVTLINCISCKTSHKAIELIKYDYHYYMIDVEKVMGGLD